MWNSILIFCVVLMFDSMFPCNESKWLLKMCENVCVILLIFFFFTFCYFENEKRNWKWDQLSKMCVLYVQFQQFNFHSRLWFFCCWMGFNLSFSNTFQYYCCCSWFNISLCRGSCCSFINHSSDLFKWFFWIVWFFQTATQINYLCI